MRKRIVFYIILVIVSWGLEYIWIRFDLSLEFRLCGIRFIPLFLMPAAVLWPLICERVNIIDVWGRFGKFRWWTLAFLIPMVIAVISASILVAPGVYSVPEGANAGTRILALIVDLPLNYVLWFLLICSSELCWRGSFLLRRGQKSKSIGLGLGSSALWALSLAGFILPGYFANNAIQPEGILSILSFFAVGFYQSMIYRRSESVLVSAFSALCILLINALVFSVPVTGIHPLLQAMNPKSIPAEIGFLVSSSFLGLLGLIMWGKGEKEASRNIPEG